VPGTGQTVLAVLEDPALISPAGGPYPAIAPATYPNQFVAVRLLDKVRLISQRLHLVDADLGWLAANAGAYGGVDFAQLPVAPAQPAIDLDGFLRTLLLVKLARLFAAAPPQATVQSLYDLIGGVTTGAIATEAAAQAALATIAGWTVPDVTALAAALGAAFPVDYQRPAFYDSLRTLEAMIAATAGEATGAQLVQWAAVPADEAAAETMAASAQSVVKARYSNSEWLAAAPAIMNPIREHRSAALQTYLVAQRDGGGALVYGDTNGLFDHFLIDTQMSSCEVTTRVIQAYVAVQILVERARMHLEAPAIVVDPRADDAWAQWSWMKRYRVWQAAREVFLYPENWLVESQRPNRTELFQKLEQEVHQNEHTADALELTALGYIDRLDELAHLFVTGTCQDPATGVIHVVARTTADPPRYYHRSLEDGAWTGWMQVPLDIKAHQVVPAVYRGRLCLFWPEIKVSSEPHQNVPAVQPSSNPPGQSVAKFVSIALFFTIFRNGSWAPAQATRGKLFDVPLLPSQAASNSRAVEALYTIKVQTPAPTPGHGASLYLDVFRFGSFDSGLLGFLAALLQLTADDAEEFASMQAAIEETEARLVADATTATHLGRVVFDGRFSDLELRNLTVLSNTSAIPLLSHAQAAYGPEAQPLLPLADPDPDIGGEPGLLPQTGALVTRPADPTLGADQTAPLTFTAATFEQAAGPLLDTAPVPFRVVGPATDLSFDPTSYFIYQDSRRCYYVASQRLYQSGSTWTPVAPASPGSTPYQVQYFFHRFHQPFTRLIWHQLGSGGFPLVYDQNLQLNTDRVDPAADAFDFSAAYHPETPRVRWDAETAPDGTPHDDFLDFGGAAPNAVYNWEFFFHSPFYMAGLLTQNQQFEDAQRWLHYIFDPTHLGADPVPQRFWITKPLHRLTAADLLGERINNLLQLVNQGDTTAVGQVARWRKDPFNPFLLADLRNEAYMKAVVMAYLDNLIAWADHLFATDSREALNEATLLYVIAAEILGPKPAAIVPPGHADDSYNELAPKLDEFANALVDIENVMGPGSGGGGTGGGLPPLQTFYFKIPPNDKLLGYWGTVERQLFKLRHCQNIQGVERQLALFDARIDPGLLIKARAAGVDIGSVLTDLQAALPNYRFTFLYGQALDFVNAVRAYGTSLLGAIEKSDGAALAVLQQTIQQQLQTDTDEIFEWQIEKARHDLEALEQARAIQQSKYEFNHSQSRMNAGETIDCAIGVTVIAINAGAAITEMIAAGIHNLPDFLLGMSGFGGTPSANAKEGGTHFGSASQAAAAAGKTLASVLDKTASLARQQGSYDHRMDGWVQAAKEAQIQIEQTNAQLESAGILLQVAERNKDNHAKQVEYLQRQLDFLAAKFTSQDLYDWMVGQLATTYFQSYRLAYRLCKQVERCYRFELGVPDSDFIQFGYWDSMHKGLLAGESLNHDLRRLQAAYLEENVRRFEISRFISLVAVAPNAFAQLLLTGACDFDLSEALFDHDYPGHYNRHIVRASVTVVYPNPGKFDNVKATLTLVANKVRISTDLTAGYAEAQPGPDPRFVYSYAAVGQRIALGLGSGQDDPGLFVTAIGSNITDQRYLPFEGAGAVSGWHFEMPAASNEVPLARVTDVVFHLFYTAQYGGDALKQGALNG
jgi:hypothetical protein